MSGMNRSQVADALYREISPGLTSLQSLIFKPFESAYTKHWAKHPSTSGASSTCSRARLHRRSEQADGREQRHLLVPERRQAVVPVLHDDGQPAPRPDVEIIQRQLKSVGIELVPRFQTGGVMFGTTLPSSDWDLMMFTYLQTPNSKITSKDLYACGGDQNYGLYCNRKLDGAPEQGAEHARAGPA